MDARTRRLNELLTLEANRAVEAARDVVSELQKDELGPFGEALMQLFCQGTPDHMQFAATLFTQFCRPGAQLDAQRLLEGLQRPDRPTDKEFEESACQALMEALLVDPRAELAPLVDRLSVSGGEEALAAILLRLAPDRFWRLLDRRPTLVSKQSIGLIVGHQLPTLDQARLDALRLELEAHRERFDSTAWAEIERCLAWRQETLAMLR
jgi:hypothetical protein